MQIATDAAASWSAARPDITKDFQRDADVHSTFWTKGHELLAALPGKRKRNPEQARAAETILDVGRATRETFMRQHAASVYAALTKNQTNFVRADILAYEAANLVPGLVPTRAQVYAQGDKMQSEKDGIEVDQGIFFSHVLARPDTGTHFCHAMLLPRTESLARLDDFKARGAVDLGTAAVMRRASGSATASITTENAPACVTAWASSSIGAQSASSRPWARNEPMVLMDCGVSPIWPITGTPRSTRNAMVSAMRRPPSSLIAPQPVSFITRAADRNACSFDAS